MLPRLAVHLPSPSRGAVRGGPSGQAEAVFIIELGRQVTDFLVDLLHDEAGRVRVAAALGLLDLVRKAQDMKRGEEEATAGGRMPLMDAEHLAGVRSALSDPQDKVQQAARCGRLQITGQSG